MIEETKRGKLLSLKAGEAAEIASIEAAPATAKRLADMGFVRGAVVRMIRPGRPCRVRIGATCVGLGRALQESILLMNQVTVG
ncbi:MAG: FeoA domain-containing protein [Planctomycetota bacterium]